MSNGAKIYGENSNFLIQGNLNLPRNRTVSKICIRSIMTQDVQVWVAKMGRETLGWEHSLDWGCLSSKRKASGHIGAGRTSQLPLIAKAHMQFLCSGS
jgi:hypothetical protein